MNSSPIVNQEISNLKLQVFIISWKDQHDNALFIANSILNACEKVSIVYSDPDDHLAIYQKFSGNLIKRNNQGFFSDKFHACLNNFSGDVLLIIHADCESNSWPNLISNCINTFKNIPQVGLWSPLIEWTAFDLSKTEVSQIRNSNLSIVIQTDTIVTAFSKQIVNRMMKFKYNQNIYGWGIGWAANAYALANGRLSIVDRSIKIKHPKESGYQAFEASKQRNLFLNQCTPQELVQLSMMRTFMTRNGAKLL
jgi:hypothetical protein